MRLESYRIHSDKYFLQRKPRARKTWNLCKTFSRKLNRSRHLLRTKCCSSRCVLDCSCRRSSSITDLDLYLQYTMLEEYMDPDKQVCLRKDEVVEVMDTENPSKWLVRSADDKQNVCYAPVEYLLGRSDDSDAEDVPQKVRKLVIPIRKCL